MVTDREKSLLAGGGVNDKTERFNRFVAELRALCREHNVILGTTDYDSLRVWDRDPDYPDDDDIHQGCIENGLDSPEDQ